MAKDIKILVVEDGEYQRGIYSFVLDHLGFKNVAMTENGAEAYSLLEKESFDVIISDCEMPVMDGLALLQKVRSSESFGDIPFLMITGLSDEDLCKQANQAGVTDFITKPVTKESLQEKLNKLFDVSPD